MLPILKEHEDEDEVVVNSDETRVALWEGRGEVGAREDCSGA